MESKALVLSKVSLLPPLFGGDERVKAVNFFPHELDELRNYIQRRAAGTEEKEEVDNLRKMLRVWNRFAQA